MLHHIFAFAFIAWTFVPSMCLAQNIGNSSSALPPITPPSTQTQTVSPSAQDPMQIIARQAAVSALLNDPGSLQQALDQSVRLDKQQEPSRSKISDNIALLQAWLAADPSQRQTMLDEITHSDPDSQVKRQARYAVQSDPLKKIRSLRRENHYNEATGLANYVMHLASNILTLNTESIPRFLVDFLFIWEPFVAISPQDRSAIVIYDQHQQEIQAQKPRAVSGTIHRLRGRLKEKITQEQLQAGEWYIKHQRWHEAYQAYDQAENLQPGSGKARKGKLAAGRRISADYRQRIRTLEIPTQSSLGKDESKSQEKLAAAIIAGSPEEIQKAAEEFRTSHPASSFRDDAAYAEWTADLLAESTNQPSNQNLAEAYLRSKDARNTNAAAHLKANAAQPEVNPAAALRLAESQKRARMRSYILTGRKEDPDYPAIYPGMREQMHHIVASFGLFLPFDWVRRGVQAAIANPVDESHWRAAAIRYLESIEPDSAEAKEIAKKLAESFERSGMLNQARLYHAMALGQDRAYTDKLDEKAAQRMRETAEAQADPIQRRSLLEFTNKRFPQTKAAQKARKGLAKLDRKNPDAYQIRKDDLASWPDLWLNRGLRLEPQWFDGSKENGEMADDGVHFLAPSGRTMQFTIRYANKEDKKQISPDAKAYDEIETHLAAWRREAETRVRAEATLDRPAFLLDIQGSAGPGGLDIYPHLQPITFDEETLPLYRSPLETGK